MTAKSTSATPTPLPRIESRIVVIRHVRVMVDADLAALYGVTTKRLNERVKRNADRFPGDFMFKLTAAEKTEGSRCLTTPSTATRAFSSSRCSMPCAS